MPRKHSDALVNRSQSSRRRFLRKGSDPCLVLGRGLRKKDRPRRGRAGYAAPKLTVDEVAEAPRGEPKSSDSLAGRYQLLQQLQPPPADGVVVRRLSIERGQLVLHNCQIEPYKQAASAFNHVPMRDRRLLAHRREIHKLAKETEQRGTTLIPLAIYFKEGIAKCEIGVARGKQQYDKRQTIKKKEQDRELRRVMSRRM
jgi:SsrA-binding protein